MKIKFPFKNRQSGKHFIFINEIDADKGLFVI